MSKLFDAIGKARRERALQADIEETLPVLEITRGPKVESLSERMLPAPKPPMEGRFEAPEEHLVSLTAVRSYEAEQYRTLRHLIEQKHHDHGISVVAVTSPIVGDGKTTTAINLAGALAQSKQSRVLMIDFDLRRPSLSQQIGLSQASAGDGLVGAILNQDRALSDIVRFNRRFNFGIAPAGAPQATPYELLKSPRVAELLAEARRDYEYVIVDTPPVGACPDCLLIERHVDGFLLVIGAHKTPRKLVDGALSDLSPGKVLGMVFNGDSREAHYYARYNSGATKRRGAEAGGEG